MSQLLSIMVIALGLWTMCWCFMLEIAPALKRIAEALETIAKERP